MGLSASCVRLLRSIEHQILTRMTAPTNSDTATTPTRAVVVSDACSALAGARYRSSYMDSGKRTWTPWKTVGPHWGIARNHFLELSEVWTKNTEWDFSGSHDLVWNEMRGYECFECGIPLPAPLGQEQPSAVGNTHRGRFIDKLNILGQTAETE